MTKEEIAKFAAKTIDDYVSKANKYGGLFLNNRLLYGNPSMLYRTTSPSELQSLLFYGETRIPTISRYKPLIHIASRTISPSRSHGVVAWTKSLPFWQVKSDTDYSSSPIVLTVDGSGRQFRTGTSGKYTDELIDFEEIPYHQYSLSKKDIYSSELDKHKWSVGIKPEDKLIQTDDLTWYNRTPKGYLFMGRVVQDKRIRPQVHISLPYAKLSRDGLYVNEAYNISIAGKPLQIFLVVKDNEPNYYSLHFKTDKDLLTELDKLDLTRNLVLSLPSGSYIRTHGDVSPGAANMFFNRLQRAGLVDTGQTFDVGMKNGWNLNYLDQYGLTNENGILKFPILYKYYKGGKINYKK